MNDHDSFIKKIFVIKETGLPVFQESFIQEDQDQVLLSGFLAAILAFTRHLGSDITTIDMGQFFYYFKIIHSLIIVTGTEEQIDESEINRFYTKLEQSKEFQEFANETLKSEAVQSSSDHTTIIKDLLHSVLAQLQLSPKSSNTRISSVDELIQISKIALQIKEGAAPKDVAEEIFGEGLQSKDKAIIEDRIQLIDQFNSSINTDKSIKENLTALSTYLKRTSRASSIFGF